MSPTPEHPTTLPIHPAADLFPALSEAELHDLAEDIRQHGLHEPIKLYQGQILDGRHRYKACAMADVPPRFETLPDDTNPYDYVWSANAERRHLDVGTKTVIRVRQLRASKEWAAKRQQQREEANQRRREATLTQPRTEDGRHLASKSGLVSRDTRPDTREFSGQSQDDRRERTQIAKAIGVSPATAQRAITLVERRPDLADRVQANEISLGEAMRLLKKAEVAERAGQLPEGKFRVVYADPPWKYSSGSAAMDGYGPAARHYPPMSIAELCALDLKNRVADDAVLFLWVTSPMLEESFQVIRAWGFTYKASFVWDKVRHNYGHYNSVRHEFLLVCTRGSCTPDNSQLHDSVVTLERSDEHSAKPEYFRKLIDTLYPHGPRLELFATSREPAP
ncbi:MAG TPA: MT-A70 family methyltransferase [Alphaproteobacteria bacterium]|nr:MT-A70 family methyltransferase [Alphaproteobacteria bacterium]